MVKIALHIAIHPFLEALNECLLTVYNGSEQRIKIAISNGPDRVDILRPGKLAGI